MKAARILALLGTVLAAAACSHAQKPAAQVDDAGLARLNEDQMQPVDDARVEEGRARDALARAKANEADARARLDVANTERSVADAQLKRSQAERDLLKKEYADREQMAKVDEDIRASQERIKSADLKRQYLERMVQVAQAENKLAQSHIKTAEAMTEQAKLRAMKAANVPEAESANNGEVDSRVAQLQRNEADERKRAADLRASAVDLYNRWQETDSRVRLLARPESLPIPPPTEPR
jgi:chromosome segregation ATPase